MTRLQTILEAIETVLSEQNWRSTGKRVGLTRRQRGNLAQLAVSLMTGKRVNINPGSAGDESETPVMPVRGEGARVRIHAELKSRAAEMLGRK